MDMVYTKYQVDTVQMKMIDEYLNAAQRTFSAWHGPDHSKLSPRHISLEPRAGWLDRVHKQAAWKEIKMISKWSTQQRNETSRTYIERRKSSDCVSSHAFIAKNSWKSFSVKQNGDAYGLQGSYWPGTSHHANETTYQFGKSEHAHRHHVATKYQLCTFIFMSCSWYLFTEI